MGVLEARTEVLGAMVSTDLHLFRGGEGQKLCGAQVEVGLVFGICNMASGV